jgi:hypothetical protein
MCIDAYREALTRDLSSTALPAPTLTPTPSHRRVAEAGRQGVVGRPLRYRPTSGQDDLESRGVAAGTTGRGWCADFPYAQDELACQDYGQV